jgi:glycosyltransferase involved in cell wall biosynthesis
LGSNLDLSIVIPLYNEEECVHALFASLKEACDLLDLKYEIVFIDDGSTDDTYKMLSMLHDKDPVIKIVKFRKNFGQTAAMVAGFKHARGNIIISMDGDLQNDPADIPRLLARLNEGYDVVCGWRKDRKDKLISRRIPSVMANWLIAKITGVPIHDNGCSLKAYRASIIKNVTLYAGMHRFIPAMSTLSGAKIAEIIVNHHPRRFGRSKYGIGRTWGVVLDIMKVKMITDFASRPALWFGILGFPFIFFGLSALLVAAGLYLGRVVEEWMVTSTVGFLLLFLGAHLFSLGIIAELCVETGDDSSNKSLNETITVL